MSNFMEVIVIAEGYTEKRFMDEILSPYMAGKNIFMQTPLVGKPGKKGGDVRFSRVARDIEMHLKQRKNTFVSTFVDYYGIKKDWPGLDDARKCNSPKAIADAMNLATRKKVVSAFADQGADDRFIPFIAVHEFEALLFSDSEILASQLNVDISMIEKILNDCGEPERINNSPDSTPSRRLKRLYAPYKKKTTGITIANLIGIEKIRRNCPLFDEWLSALEKLQGESHGKA